MNGFWRGLSINWKRVGELAEGKCFSFITPLGLGGEIKADNVMIIPISEHFRGFGEIFRQIKDLPDGAQVQIRVVP